MFITFEGPEGSGKTTQIQLLTTHLQSSGQTVLATREPGGTPISEQVRQVLHDLNNEAMSSEAEILLYSASRAQLVNERIRPALAEGQIVLCDRFADSTLAYQGYGRGLDLTALQQITQFATGGLRPNLTFYFDLDIDQGLIRRQEGDLEMNRMDRQHQTFYERVQAGYRTLIAAEPERWHVLNADRPIPAIQAEIQQVVDGRLVVTNDDHPAAT